MAAYKTAIKRNKISAPAARLKADGRLTGRVLDYGCGRGGDAERLGCEGYDPHYYPIEPVGTFDTIMCNFVLNVIEQDALRREVLWDIASLLAEGGRAYITVRTDKKALTGYTSKDTWQGYIVLDLPVVARGSGYTTYEFTAADKDCEILATTFDK